MAGSWPGPAILLFGWTSTLQGTKEKQDSSPTACTRGNRARDGEPSCLEHHHQAGLSPRVSCSPQGPVRETEEDTLTSGRVWMPLSSP